MTGAVAALATACSLLRSWPQVARILITRDDSGVSTGTWMIATFSFVSWTTIGFAENIFALKLNNGICLIGSAAVLCVLEWHRHRSFVRTVGVILASLAICVSVLTIIGHGGLQVMSIALATCMYVPQAWKSATHNISGVSTFSYALALAATLLWGLYGLMIGALFLALPTPVMAVASGFVLYKKIRAGQLQRSADLDNEAVAIASP